MNGCFFGKFFDKIWVGFCLNTRERFFLEVQFQIQQKEQRFFLKTVIEIFKIALRLRDRHVFMWQPLEILNDFNTLTLKQIFWKRKTFFKKLEYSFLVESTKIESAIFLCKTAPSQANVKANRMDRGGSRTAATSKMECFVIIVNGWKPLTIITKHSILDVAAALDPPLMGCTKWYFANIYFIYLKILFQF